MIAQVRSTAPNEPRNERAVKRQDAIKKPCLLPVCPESRQLRGRLAMELYTSRRTRSQRSSKLRDLHIDNVVVLPRAKNPNILAVTRFGVRNKIELSKDCLPRDNVLQRRKVGPWRKVRSASVRGRLFDQLEAALKSDHHRLSASNPIRNHAMLALEGLGCCDRLVSEMTVQTARIETLSEKETLPGPNKIALGSKPHGWQRDWRLGHAES